MDNRAVQVFKDVRDRFMETYLQLEELTKDVQNQTDPHWHVDTAFAMREANKYAEELGKELRRLQTLCTKIVAFESTRRMKTKYKTKHCIGESTETKVPKIPYKRRNDPKNYDAIMADLGVPQEIMLQELVRVHWPNYKDYCAEKLSRGENLPVPYDDCITEFGLKLRKLREVDANVDG